MGEPKAIVTLVIAVLTALGGGGYMGRFAQSDEVRGGTQFVTLSKAYGDHIDTLQERIDELEARIEGGQCGPAHATD